MKPYSFHSLWPRLLLSGCLFPILTLPSPAGEPASSLRSMLSPEEFHRAGLDKLTQDELDFLSGCLARARATPIPRSPDLPASRAEPPRKNDLPAQPPAPVKSLPQGDAAFGAEEQLHAAVEVLQAVPAAIRSRMAGSFEGWNGHTEFRLENGQVWQQAAPGVFSVSLTNPAVVIEKGLMGVFYLHVEGYGSRIKVRRLK